MVQLTCRECELGYICGVFSLCFPGSEMSLQQIRCHFAYFSFIRFVLSTPDRAQQSHLLHRTLRFLIVHCPCLLELICDTAVSISPAVLIEYPCDLESQWLILLVLLKCLQAIVERGSSEARYL